MVERRYLVLPIDAISLCVWYDWRGHWRSPQAQWAHNDLFSASGFYDFNKVSSNLIICGSRYIKENATKCFDFFFWEKIVSPVFKSCFATCFVTFEDVLRVLVKSSDVGFEIGILGKRFVALVALCFLICAAEVLILSQSAASEMPAHCWQHRNR